MTPSFAGSNPAIPATSGQSTLCSDFLFGRKSSARPLALPFSQKSRSHRLTACKRAVFKPIGSRPTFCGCACRRRSFSSHPPTSEGTTRHSKSPAIRPGISHTATPLLLPAKSHAAPSLFACRRAHDAPACCQLVAGLLIAALEILFSYPHRSKLGIACSDCYKIRSAPTRMPQCDKFCSLLIHKKLRSATVMSL